jgi:hypothetical protein
VSTFLTGAHCKLRPNTEGTDVLTPIPGDGPGADGAIDSNIPFPTSAGAGSSDDAVVASANHLTVQPPGHGTGAGADAHADDGATGTAEDETQTGIGNLPQIEFDDINLGHKLGSGGYGDVYMGVVTGFGDVAVKKIKATESASDRSLC